MDADDVREFGDMAAEAGEALWGAEVTIGGISYPAEVVEPRAKGLLVSGGEALEAELVVRIRKAVCETCPAREKQLLHKGAKWIIREATGNAVDAVWTLRCEPKN